MSTPNTEAIVVFCTAGSHDQASAIAHALVERRLAACVNIVQKVCSVYRWEGSVQQEEESLLIVKSRADRFRALRDAIRELHTYDVPEILAVPAHDVDPEYLAWMRDETTAPSD